MRSAGSPVQPCDNSMVRPAIDTDQMSIPVSLPARLPACPPARLPACPPARLPACPPARLPACPPARPPARPSACSDAVLAVVLSRRQQTPVTSWLGHLLDCNEPIRSPSWAGPGPFAGPVGGRRSRAAGPTLYLITTSPCIQISEQPVIRAKLEEDRRRHASDSSSIGE